MLKENIHKRETKWKNFEPNKQMLWWDRPNFGQIRLKNYAKSGLRNAKQGETRDARRAKPEESKVLNEKSYI